VNGQAPAAIDKAFRIYLLPQGLVPIALSTTLFPTLSRLAARRELDQFRATLDRGLRWNLVLLFPSAVLLAVLADPVTRLIYQRGTFDAGATHVVAGALVCWTISLPAQGLTVLLARAFFSLQKPAPVLKLSAAYVAINAVVSVALYKPFGANGVVLGTVTATIVLMLGQLRSLERLIGRTEAPGLVRYTARVGVASAPAGAAAYGVWKIADSVLGRSLPGQFLSLGAGSVIAIGLFVLAGRRLRIPELSARP
jgi:putative peptidoglycan lipid II flippase